MKLNFLCLGVDEVPQINELAFWNYKGVFRSRQRLGIEPAENIVAGRNCKREILDIRCSGICANQHAIEAPTIARDFLF